MPTRTMAIVISVLFCAIFASEAQARGLEYGNSVWVVDEGDIISCPEGTPAHFDIEPGGLFAELFFDCCGHWEQEVSGGGQVHTNIIIPGFGVASPAGSPALPARGFWVEIDRGVDPVLSETSIVENVSVPIYPVLPVQPDHNEDELAPPFEKDATVYGQDMFFPSESGEMIYTAFGGATRYAFVVVSPVKYNPVSGELSVATSLTLNLDLSDVSGPIVPYIGGTTGADYLIIVKKEIYDTCEDGNGKNLIRDLARWKTQKGFQSKIVLTEDMDVFGFDISDPGNSNDAIQLYLQDAWDTWATRPSYLLLIGDHPDVPSNHVNHVKPDSTKELDYASDFPYALLEGGDQIPDLMMGRLPVETGADCVAALKKILQYDRDPVSGDWYDNNLFAAKFEDKPSLVGNFEVCSSPADCAPGFSCLPGITASHCVKECLWHANCDDFQICVTSHGGLYDGINELACHERPDCKADKNYMDLVASLTDFFSTTRQTNTVLTSNLEVNSDYFCGQMPWANNDYNSCHGDSMPDGYAGWDVLPNPFNSDSSYWPVDEVEPDPLACPWGECGQRAEIRHYFQDVGVGLVLHRDHGEYSWSSPRFFSYDAYALTNSDATPIVLSMNCSTGVFAVHNSLSSDPNPLISTTCISERFIESPTGGAVAVVAATYGTSSPPNNTLVQGAISSIWPDYLLMSEDDLSNFGNAKKRMGKMFLDMKAYNESLYPFDPMDPTINFGTLIHREIYHLFGDPEMYYRPSEPLELPSTNVAHDAVIITSGSGTFNISAYISEFSDLNYALASLSREDDSGELVQVGTGEFLDDIAVISFPPPTESDVWKLTITHYSMTPYVVDIPVCILANDCDDDGWDDDDDNCWTEYNPDQENCDEDEFGDVCDDDICIEFDGIEDVIHLPIFSSSGITGQIWTLSKTLSYIKVNYLAHGAALDGDGYMAPEEDHSVQLRWCSCEGYPQDIVGAQDCKIYNCIQDGDSQHGTQYGHRDWHLVSTQEKTSTGSSVIPPYEPPHCTGGEVDYYPSTSCDRDTSWSTWGPDEVSTNRCSFHCTPQEKTFQNPLNGVTPKSLYWNWDNELWWPAIDSTTTGLIGNPTGLADELTGFAADQANPVPVWGFLWIRPEDTSKAGGRPWDEANNYIAFRVQHEDITANFHGILNPAYWLDLPWILFPPFNAIMQMPAMGVDPAIAPALPHTDTARFGMELLSIEVGDEAGVFKYADNLIGPDAAIGGLMISFIDGYSLDTEALGFSTGSSAGSVPTTIGFASAMYGWTEDAGSAYGLAVFGGQSASGVKASNIWLGQFGGLNNDGVPFFSWHDATPLSGEMPPPRSGASMVFDENNKRLLMFGGTMERDQVADDIWEYDLVNGTWNQFDQSFLSLTGFALVRMNNRFYVAGGRDAAGNANTNVYRVDFADLQPTVEADMANGPGARDRMSMGFDSSSSGGLILFGGTDASGTDRNDLWKLDLTTSLWSQTASDCVGETCPAPGDPAFVIAGRGGRVSVHTVVDENGDNVFSLDQNGEWTGNRSSVPPMTGAIDCDGDGVREQETALACRSSSEWYAEVGKMQCSEPGESDLLECGAGDPGPMTLSESWSPGGWEWIVDLTEGPDDYTYVLTDDTLYTFDTLDLSGGLYPIDSDELIVPGSCWFCGGPDWSFDVKVHGDNAYVASWSGVHVFDLSDPEAPVEVGHFASYAPVIDMAFFRGIAYLADGFGITVVSVADPTVPTEVERVQLGAPVEAVGVNEEAWRLMALMPGSLRQFNLGRNPFKPTETGSVGLAGWSFYEMKVDGRWTYLNGIWTQTVLDEGEGVLSTQGTHDLRAWVNGRLLSEDRAERVRWLFNEFQVWEE